MLIAVDTGGTKTLVASFNRRGELAAERKFATPRDTEEYIETVAVAIHAVTIHAKKIEAIVVAIPGVVEENSARWCANLGWTNFPIVERLRRHFDCPILLENDANLAGLAETRALPHTVTSSLYLTVSTGIGMGLTIQNQLHPLFTHTEVGHMVLEYDGKLREWESFASGRAIHHKYGKFARDIHDKRAWNQIADKISRGLLVLIPAFNPDIIILGGSIGTYFDRYEKPLLAHLEAHHNKNLHLPPIRQAVHPEQAVIYGCYYYAIDTLHL